MGRRGSVGWGDCPIFAGNISMLRDLIGVSLYSMAWGKRSIAYSGWKGRAEPAHIRVHMAIRVVVARRT